MSWLAEYVLGVNTSQMFGASQFGAFEVAIADKKNTSTQRTAGTVYQNDSGRKRRLIISISGEVNGNFHMARILVGSANPPTIELCRKRIAANGSLHINSVYGEVPQDWYYKLDTTIGAGGNSSLNVWTEIDE